MTRLAALFVLGGLLLAGCAGEDAPRDGPIDTTRVEGCIVEEEMSRTLRTWAEVTTFFEDHCEVEPPDLDLDRQVVVVHATGQRPTTGYDVDLRSAELQGDAARVVFTRHEPGLACGTLDVVTHPTAVYILDARPDSVTLEHVVQADECA